MSRLRALNPVRTTILFVGLVLARVGLIDEARVRRTADLAWPRVVTGVARMSKNAADTAMVGIALGPVAIAGVGFAGPFWGMAFALGGGFAAGTIALVSQRYGAEAHGELGQAVRSSVLVVVAVSLPIVGAFYAFPDELIGLLSGNERAIAYGADYLRVVAFGVPFAGLNLVGSRVLVGTDDAWIPMVLRGGGATTNIGLNALFIFGLDMGVVGAGLGTVLANVAVTGAFAVGLARGGLPGTGEFPVQVDPVGAYVDPGEVRDLVEIGLPVIGKNMMWTLARFPMLRIVDIFGASVVAGYVIARRIFGLMNVPGWGFGLASSSIVGQELGDGQEATAETYGREIVRFAVGVYLVSALLVALFAEPIVGVFVTDPTDPAVPVAVALVYAACVAVIAQGVNSVIAGALNASGDTRWPFYSQALGMFGVTIPFAYLGATTSLGLWGLYLSFLGETVVPAVINYYRFSTGKWKAISRDYRPETGAADD